MIWIYQHIDRLNQRELINKYINILIVIDDLISDFRGA